MPDYPGASATTSPAVKGSVSWDRAVADQATGAAVQFLDDVAATDAVQSASRIAIARLRLPRAAHVLDAGCGAGAFFPALADAVGPAGRITGLDHSAGMLREAARAAAERGLSPEIALVTADAHELPFPDATFDAAHTERVLLHVERPADVLAELRRVVKPGGWIVCVEPDLAGLRLDLPGLGWERALVDGFCASLRNPGIGLELNRLMAGAGLEERTLDAVTEIEREYPDEVAEIFAEAAEEAVRRGWLTRTAADAALAALERAGRDGTYTTYSSMFVAAGRVPAAS